MDKVELIRARLKSAARHASEAHRQMAEAKSLRQEGNTERRIDLYAWPEPSQTLEGQADATIEALQAQVAAKDAEIGRAREAFQDLVRASRRLPGVSMALYEELGELRAALGQGEG